MDAKPTEQDPARACAAAHHLQPLPTDLLLRIAQGRIDVPRLAAVELASRGLGLAGEWVGFDKARMLWEID